MVLGRTRVQKELFIVGTEGHVLARFGLDPGNGRLLVATAEADETKVDEMGGSYSEICFGERRGQVVRGAKRQGHEELNG